MAETELNDVNLARISRQIEDLQKELGALRATVDAMAFYKRVLIQAVLTAGGRLKVDPSLSEAAKAETRKLWIAGGEVSLVDCKFGGLIE